MKNCGMILLKNEDQVLPLQAESGCKVAVIGANAAAIHSNGGGSAEIKALYEISPLMGIKKLLGGNVKVSYAPGYVENLQSVRQIRCLNGQDLHGISCVM